MENESIIGIGACYRISNVQRESDLPSLSWPRARTHALGHARPDEEITGWTGMSMVNVMGRSRGVMGWRDNAQQAESRRGSTAYRVFPRGAGVRGRPGQVKFGWAGMRRVSGSDGTGGGRRVIAHDRGTMTGRRTFTGLRSEKRRSPINTASMGHTCDTGRRHPGAPVPATESNMVISNIDKHGTVRSTALTYRTAVNVRVTRRLHSPHCLPVPPFLGHLRVRCAHCADNDAAQVVETIKRVNVTEPLELKRQEEQ
ncbi:hypothetical protein HD554DRAFT_2036571 [Boletus coccyginus]|nr:hypothetical protein HD554DRAFT_2036571 [Boletus coccyginus]